ncbi:flagellar motor switch protein FliG [Thermocrinis albus DSM 14484]|uniref:Flagellar motor switch protein FliG n=1 Tax=Thermocrinis albus (strain DSM 14484 / JCM 11386 / HI 11/12) TaxID=638303 RepID=D3SNY5_THEAH|nr:flagellar motor switch protein FliG [Thermocrinis albus]ADC88872.1 flagellar motor switch protein FliG [Thermocrinis albus DSM 14484]
MAEARGKLSKAHKAAILLMALPPQIAVEVMKELSEEEIQEVLILATSLEGVTLKDLDEVGKEFLEEYKATSFLSPDLDALLEFARKVLPPEKFAKIYEFLSSSTLIKSFQELERVDNRLLANLLRSEHPQTIAVVLSQLSYQKSAEILKLLPDTLRVEVVRRMATLENISPEALGELIEVMAEEIRGMGVSGIMQKMEGVPLVAGILNLLDKNTAGGILSKLEEEDPYLAEKIKEKMFTFEDIRKLDNRSIVEILKAVERNTLLLALKGAPEDIKEKFFSNMSKKAAEIMKEDMEAMGPVKVSEVEKAQKEVVRIIKQLADQGVIDLSGGESYV